MTATRWIFTGLVLCVTLQMQAQKYEQEARIRASEMPAAALTYLEKNYPGQRRTRHYMEHSRQGQEAKLTLYFESKFKSAGYRYSVKFDSLGQLYDVERIIKSDQLPSPARHSIHEDLGASFQHFRIEKIQERYLPTGSLAGYELEVRGKRGEVVGYFELQYGPGGQRLSLEPVEQDSNPFFFF